MNTEDNLEQLAKEVANFALQEPEQQVTLQNLPDDILIDIIERIRVPEQTTTQLLDALESSTNRRDYLENLNEDVLDQMDEQIEMLIGLGEDATEQEQQLEEAKDDFEDIELSRAYAQERVDEDMRNYIEFVIDNMNLVNFMRQTMRL